jgi:7-cyano-7-deazaguanine synthase
MIQTFLDQLPEDTNKKILLLSGGLDSAVLLRLYLQKYGKDNIKIIYLKYGQRSAKFEQEKVDAITELLGVEYEVIDVGMGYANMMKGISYQLDADLPLTNETQYCPGKSLIFYSYVTTYAYINNIDTVIIGINANDNQMVIPAATTVFVEKYNELLAVNYSRNLLQIITPLANITKSQCIQLLEEMDGNLDFVENTISCYAPNESGESCGICGPCIGRKNAFASINKTDKITYVV